MFGLQQGSKSLNLGKGSIGGFTRAQWRENLAFVPAHVVDKTLSATTQMVSTVEAETCMVMRDHLQTCLYPLKEHRIDDVAGR